MTEVDETELCIVCNKLDNWQHCNKNGNKPSWSRSETFSKPRFQSKQRRQKRQGNDSCDPLTLTADLRPQLRPVFLLQQVFKLSLKDESTLEALKTLGNPSEWFRTCSSCTELIDQGIETLWELKILNNKLNDVVVKILNGLVNSNEGALKGKYVLTRDESTELAKIRLNFRKKIRNCKVLESQERIPATDVSVPIFDGCSVGYQKEEGTSPGANDNSRDKTVTVLKKASYSSSRPRENEVSPRTGRPKRKPRGRNGGRPRTKPLLDPVVLDAILIQNGDQHIDMTLTPRDVPGHVTALKKAEYGQVKNSEFKCIYCDKCFRNKYHTMAHTQRFHMGIQRPWKCSLCNDTFGLFIHLKAHLKEHDKGKRLMCPVCNTFSCLTRGSLDMHIIDHQKNAPSPVCDQCQKSYPNFRLFVQHMTAEHGFIYNFTKRPKEICELCTQEFVSNKRLKFHQIVKHGFPDEGKRFHVCPECGEVQLDKQRLDEHVAKVHEKKDNFFCEKCGEGFMIMKDLKAHSERKHSTDPQTCLVCGIVKRNKIQMNKHMLVAHPNTQKMSVEELQEYGNKIKKEKGDRHKCAHCGEAFPFAHLLQKHRRENHGKDEKFKCPICRKEFKGKSTLKLHHERVHLKIKVNCEFCGKQFFGRDILRAHKRKSCKVKKTLETGGEGEVTSMNADVVESSEGDLLVLPILVTSSELPDATLILNAGFKEL